MIKFRVKETKLKRPEEILAYEIIESKNILAIKNFLNDLNDFLSLDAKKDLEWIIKFFEENPKTYEKDFDYTNYLITFKDVIKALEKKSGQRIKQLLWLTDIDTAALMCETYVMDFISNIDAYETGVEVLKTTKGIWYGYSSKPTKLGKEYVVNALECDEKLNKVIVNTDLNGKTHTVYTTKSRISLNELAYICYRSKQGYLTSRKEAQTLINDNAVNPEDFIFVNLSPYGISNRMFLVKDLKSDIRIY